MRVLKLLILTLNLLHFTFEWMIQQLEKARLKNPSIQNLIYFWIFKTNKLSINSNCRLICFCLKPHNMCESGTRCRDKERVFNNQIELHTNEQNESFSLRLRGSFLLKINLFSFLQVVYLAPFVTWSLFIIKTQRVVHLWLWCDAPLLFSNTHLLLFNLNKKTSIN